MSHIAYLALVYKQPSLVGRLTRRLLSKRSSFYIHVDSSVEEAPFRRATHGLDGVHFLPPKERVASLWGDFGIVQATNALLRRALADRRNDWFVLLSGQDYPLWSDERIHSFFNKHSSTAFVHCAPIDSVWPENIWYERVHDYKFNLTAQRGDFLMIPPFFSRRFRRKWPIADVKRLLKEKGLNSVASLIWKRVFPLPLDKPYGGSAWWALPRVAAEAVIRLTDSRRDLARYFRHSLFPDELYFQSCLRYIANTTEGFEIKPPLTYTDWTKKVVPLPVTFTSSDLPQLLGAAETHFLARKFDEKESLHLLDLIDNDLLHYSANA